MKQRKYVVYDMRAVVDVDSAEVLCMASSLEEAKDDADMFGGGVIYSYEESGKDLIDERFEAKVVS
jgi:hypothetical protein